MTTQPTEKALFRIDYDGVWYHDGAPIRRHALAQLFARRGLRIDANGRYWLSSPESRYPVTVEDVPFIIVDYDINGPDGDPAIDLVGNMGDVVALGPDRILELRAEPRGGVPVPYVLVRDGLYARLSRSVFYNLLGRAVADRDRMLIRSRGVDHVLGHAADQDRA